MTTLSINVNKIATLRNARGTNSPNLLEVTKDILKFGAVGITVHPRPDERHITKKDAYDIGQWLKLNTTPATEYNMEGYPDDRFLQMLQDIRPQQATLVPDPPNVLTSNAGWNCHENVDILSELCQQFTQWNIRSSLFINPYDLDPQQIAALKKIQPNRVELYTESYARAFATDQQNLVLDVYVSAAHSILDLGIELNAGHDLNQKNLGLLISKIPEIEEVSIGHGLICEALYDGFETTIKNYLDILACP